MKKLFAGSFVVLTAATLIVNQAKGDPVRNGNELALKFSGAEPAVRKQLQDERTGMIHVFRFLKVTAVQTNAPTEGAFKLLTVEPSSDMRVELRISPAARLSMELAGTIDTGECVAARGRIKTLGGDKADLIIVEEAVLLHKDNPQPKAGRELLPEVDPNAVR